MARTPSCHAAAPSVSHWLASSSRHQPLSPRTVIALGRRIQAWQGHPDGAEQAPCTVRRRALQARALLVTHNLRLVGHTWRRHRSSLPLEAESTADAFQEAAISLLRAAELFDPSRGYSFSTYASFWVRRGFSEMERRQKRLIRLPVSRTEIVMRARRLAEQHQAASGKMPSLEWLAERCGPRGTAEPLESLQQALQQWEQTQLLELDRPLNPEAEPGEAVATALDQLADPRGLDPAACAAGEEAAASSAADFPDGPALLQCCASDGGDAQRALLPLLLQVLKPVERRLLWHRYLRERPLTVRQLQRVMGLDALQQQAIERRALEKLRAEARRQGMAIPA